MTGDSAPGPRNRIGSLGPFSAIIIWQIFRVKGKSRSGNISPREKSGEFSNLGAFDGGLCPRPPGQDISPFNLSCAFYVITILSYRRRGSGRGCKSPPGIQYPFARLSRRTYPHPRSRIHPICPSCIFYVMQRYPVAGVGPGGAASSLPVAPLLSSSPE